MKCHACDNELCFTVVISRTATVARSRRNASFRVGELIEEGARPLLCGQCGSPRVALGDTRWEDLLALVTRHKEKGEREEGSS